MNQEKIGAYIMQKRKEKEMTREDLAAAVAVSERTVRQWESGKYVPDYFVINDLCEELDISVGELVTAADRPDKSIHLYDEEEILDLLHQVQAVERQNKVVFLMALAGIVLMFARSFCQTILGTVLLVLTFAIATTAFIMAWKS